MKTLHKNRSTRLSLLVSVLLIAGLTLGMTGCSDQWEGQTYQTLAASKALIDTAAQDYINGDIQRTQVAHDLIVNARTAQNTAATLFQDYALLKAAGADSNTLAQRQAAVVQAMDSLAPLIANVRDLITARKPQPTT